MTRESHQKDVGDHSLVSGKALEVEASLVGLTREVLALHTHNQRQLKWHLFASVCVATVFVLYLKNELLLRKSHTVIQTNILFNDIHLAGGGGGGGK